MAVYNGAKYLSDFEAKKAIVEIGKRMYARGFVASNDGNISIKVGTNAIWTTPTGVSKGYMTPDMLVKVNLEGRILAGRSKPSSEMKMHLRVYQENPDVMAVAHAHPPVATSFAIAGINLDKAILPEAVVNLGSVPIAHYATPGSTDVPDSIAPYCKSHNAVLLANHGALSWGKDVFEAYHRLESLEYYATVLMYTGNIIGKANELSCNQVTELIAIREKLGITSGGVPPCSITATNDKDVVTSVNQEKMNTVGNTNPNHATYVDTRAGCEISIRQQTKEQSKEQTKEQTKEQIMNELIAKITSRVLENLKG